MLQDINRSFILRMRRNVIRSGWKLAIIYYQRVVDRRSAKFRAKIRIAGRALHVYANFREEWGEKEKREKDTENTLITRCSSCPSLAFPLSQFRSAFKCCLGRNNVVWRAATGRDTCYRCQSPRICRDSSCKLKIPFISVPLSLPFLVSALSLEMPQSCNSETTYFPPHRW